MQKPQQKLQHAVASCILQGGCKDSGPFQSPGKYDAAHEHSQTTRSAGQEDHRRRLSERGAGLGGKLVTSWTSGFTGVLVTLRIFVFYLLHGSCRFMS